jgi:hypothetical protein
MTPLVLLVLNNGYQSKENQCLVLVYLDSG